MQFILVLYIWHHRKYDTLSTALFATYTFFLIKWLLSFDYFKYFDEGMSQKTQGMNQKDPLPYKSVIICIYISREAIHSKNIYLHINLRNLPAELLRSLWQNNFAKMIHFTIDSINISAPFLRTAEHTFGIRCLTS